MTFEQLVDTYQHRIFGFALNLCGNPADAEEIAQEAGLCRGTFYLYFGSKDELALAWIARFLGERRQRRRDPPGRHAHGLGTPAALAARPAPRLG